MSIKFLKAGSGDSILIQHKKYNVLIDGGNDSNYLLSEIDKIYSKNESIDLLVITHHDDDHIRGIINFVKLVVEGNYGVGFIKKVFFNSPKMIMGTVPIPNEKLLSYTQSFELEKLFIKLNLNWELCDEDTKSISFEDLKIDFLSPVAEDLKLYASKAGEHLSSMSRCDWTSTMSELEKYIDDENQDISLPNRCSIVLSVECELQRILLTGDVTPDRLELIVLKLLKEKGTDSIFFDYIKLPHHGSYRSLNRSIVEKIKCYNYIISTNSKKHYLPNKRALLKLVKFLRRDREKIQFLFNYDDALQNLKITEKEKDLYNFKLTPNNRDYGVVI
ncbi:MBL fold metallo-hydrolase [Flavobacterium sp.]|uniref:ComEC/Rec2 family competence protein n=1 Tax=Flavobacterium sp. TaxID=239 RepID=UPI0031DA8218